MQQLAPLIVRVSRLARVLALRGAAAMLLLGGMVMFPLPIPIGLPMIAAGLALLISSSQGFAMLVQRFRQRRPGFDGWLREVEPKIPALFRIPLRRTDPQTQPERPGTTVEAPPACDDE
jgi:hypothetical protein